MKQLSEELVAQYGLDTVKTALEPLIRQARRDKFEAIIAQRLNSLTFVVEDPYDAHNGAAAIRTVEGFGLSDVHIIEYENRFRFSSSVTRGCEKWIRIHKHKQLQSCVEHLENRGFELIATHPDATSTIADIDCTRPVAVCFGNEHAGLTDALTKKCSRSVRIPMHGFSQSLNLSVSLAVVASELSARRRQVLGQPGDLSGKDREHLYCCYLVSAVRAAHLVLKRHAAK